MSYPFTTPKPPKPPQLEKVRDPEIVNLNKRFHRSQNVKLSTALKQVRARIEVGWTKNILARDHKVCLDGACRVVAWGNPYNPDRVVPGQGDWYREIKGAVQVCIPSRTVHGVTIYQTRQGIEDFNDRQKSKYAVLKVVDCAIEKAEAEEKAQARAKRRNIARRAGGWTAADRAKAKAAKAAHRDARKASR